MIEQIYTYFTIEILYMWVNLGVLPFWFVLIIFPQSQICRVFITSIFPIFILSLIYGYLLYINFYNDFDLLTNFELYLGMAKLSYLFSDSLFLILFCSIDIVQQPLSFYNQSLSYFDIYSTVVIIV